MLSIYSEVKRDTCTVGKKCCLPFSIVRILPLCDASNVECVLEVTCSLQKPCHIATRKCHFTTKYLLSHVSENY